MQNWMKLLKNQQPGEDIGKDPVLTVREGDIG